MATLGQMHGAGTFSVILPYVLRIMQTTVPTWCKEFQIFWRE